MTLTTVPSELDEDLAALVLGNSERSKELYADPHGLYDALRSFDPIYYSPKLNAYFVTSFELTKQFYRARGFSNVQDIKVELTAAQRAWAQAAFAFVDPPEHTRLRRVCAAVFTPRAVEAQRRGAARVVGELLDHVRHLPAFDFKQDFANPLPQRVISEMLGIPRVEQANFARWAADMSRALETSAAEPPTSGTAQQSSDEMMAFFEELIQHKRRASGDDLISHLVRILDGGELEMTKDDVMSTAIMLYTGGFTTTANMITNMAWTLIRNSDVYADLREHPALIPAAVEEAIRYESPARNSLRRRASTDLVFADRELAAGTTIYAILGAANRDPEVFSHPHVFDIRRETEERHVGFGGGIHVCIGASLARIEVQEAMAQLMREPMLELDADAVEWEPKFVMRRLKDLPVRWASGA